MSANGANKNLEIEMLRGIAVILTMLSHLPILLPFHSELFTKIFFSLLNPWPGVDLFFCISGYVVSKAYMGTFDRLCKEGMGWLAAQSFFIRRAYRLFPSAWLWALMGLGCSIFFNQSGVFSSWFYNIRSIATILTFSGNYANQYGLLLHPNDVYWSLALEEQFYFLFPIFLFLVKSVRWRVWLLLLFVGIQFFVDRNPFGTGASGMAFSFRLDAIMWGVLIYIFSQSQLYRNFEPHFLRSKSVSIVVGLVLLYLLVAIPAQLISMPIAVGMIALITALLVFFASFNRGYIPRITFISPLLVWVGARSYGIYLIHVFSYRLVNEGFTRYATGFHIVLDKSLTCAFILAALLIIVVLSDINYRLIEVPLRNRGSSIARQREQRILDSAQK